MVKILPAMQDTWVQSLGWEDSLENEIATHSSILAWRIPWIEDPCRLPSTGSQRVRHDWIISTFSFHTLIWDHFWVNYMLPILLMGRLFTVCQFSSVQSLSRVWLFVTPWIAACQASVHHQLPELAQTHVHWVGDAIQPSHTLSSPSPSFKFSRHPGLFQWVSSWHQVAKVLEFQIQHQSFQWILRTNFL